MENRGLYRYGQEFSYSVVQEYLETGRAIDGNTGGILKGPSHHELGINVLMRFKGEYRLVLEVEGGEYLLDPLAAERHIESGTIWNDRDRDRRKGYAPITDYSGLQVLDCTLQDDVLHSKFLLVDSRSCLALFNKYSTSRFIAELEQLNGQEDFSFWGEPRMWTDEWAASFHKQFARYREPVTGIL